MQLGVPNHFKVLLSKVMVLSVKEKLSHLNLADECQGDERK
jgi:hypothetical protein